MTVRILVGDCRVRLREFPNNFFHTVVTSWPYWGLRDYGISPTVWGGDPECEHVWGNHQTGRVTGDGDRPPDSKWSGGPSPDSQTVRSFCQLCGAWLGNFGLEPTPELYIQHGVEISREVRRVLRDDGTHWLNLGDCYNSGGRRRERGRAGFNDDINDEEHSPHRCLAPGLKPKDLVGIPWAAAFALRDDGWWLRQAIPWIKDCPMPESVDDRPTTAHEYLFLFSKSKHYYYDKVAIFEPSRMSEASRKRAMYPRYRKGSKRDDDEGKPDFITDPEKGNWPPTRNRRTADWWYDSLDLLIEQAREYLLHLEHIKDQGGMLLDTEGQPLALKVNPEGFEGDHYATFPTRLVEPCLKASVSERGACPQCGAPWERVIDKEFVPQEDVSLERGIKGAPGQKPMDESSGWDGIPRGTTHITTIGFRPTCSCCDDRYRSEFPRARSARKRWQQDMADRWWP